MQGKNVETFQHLKAIYGGDAVGATQCYKWFIRFKIGLQSIADKPRPEKLLTSTYFKKIKDLMRALVWLSENLQERLGSQ